MFIVKHSQCVWSSFLGTRPIRLIRVQIQHNPAILALSSHSWVNYTHQNLMHFTPLIFKNFDYTWSFSAELCPEGLIGITGSTLRWVLHLSKNRLRTLFVEDEKMGLYTSSDMPKTSNFVPIVPTEIPTYMVLHVACSSSHCFLSLPGSSRLQNSVQSWSGTLFLCRILLASLYLTRRTIISTLLKVTIGSWLKRQLQKH